MLHVCKADGTLVKNLPTTTEWVEDNFKQEVLAAAQKVFIQTLTKVTVDSINGKKKKASEKLEQGYVNVEAAGIGVKINDDPINMLKYYPKKTIYVGNQFQKKGESKWKRKNSFCYK